MFRKQIEDVVDDDQLDLIRNGRLDCELPDQDWSGRGATLIEINRFKRRTEETRPTFSAYEWRSQADRMRMTRDL